MKNSVIQEFRTFRETLRKSNFNEKNHNLICQLYDKLKKQLSKEQLEIHERLIGAIEKNFCDEVDFYFAKGFKLGLLIGVECFEED